jgi:hypothetical protein
MLGGTPEVGSKLARVCGGGWCGLGGGVWRRKLGDGSLFQMQDWDKGGEIITPIESHGEASQLDSSPKSGTG